MDRTQLEKVYILKQELKMWELRLEELRADMATDSVNYDGMPHSVTNNNNSPTERKAIEIADHVKAIHDTALELRQAIMDVECYIQGIKDSLMRQILERRCIWCQTWEQIGDALGYDRTTIAKRYNSFLDERFPQFPRDI